MKTISLAFDYIFAEDEWFNKVLVGGIYLTLAPLVIGLIMVMGFQVMLTRRVTQGEKGMPLWRNVSVLLKTGIRSFIVSLWYAALTLGILFLLKIPLFSVTTAIVLLSLHFILNPVILACFAATNSIMKCFNPLILLGFVKMRFSLYLPATVLTTLFIFFALAFGWMWIIVGWPMLIFLMMIVQTISFAKI